MMRILCLAVLIFMGCEKPEETYVSPPEVIEESGAAQLTDTICTQPLFRKEGFVYEKDGATYLWAGVDSSTHFDITDWELNECNLRYGLGREAFPALLKPEYTPLSEYKFSQDPIEKCLVLFSPDEVKVYPYETMISHEVINETHYGNPIMIAYCVLADLGAVYSRDYCGTELTFAVSGYTVYDSEIWGGLDAFILWDRDTESLWWPLVDRAISGPLKGHTLKKYTEAVWDIHTWAYIQENYPDALVLTEGQTQETPPKYPAPDPAIFDCH